ncbi:hypothetical protein V5F44_11080 [Xanthobacter sp. V2C-8]|uniref:hypothetical protein n=1 Tax=Xanthobacter albus TaxID=3119929 RepID=UPI00372BEDB9
MTKAKNTAPEGPLDWKYSAEDLAQIRSALPQNVTDIEFQKHATWLEFWINTPSLTLKSAIKDGIEGIEEYKHDIETLHETITILNKYALSQSDARIISNIASNNLSIVLDYITEEARKSFVIVNEMKEFAPQQKSNRLNDFVLRVCGAADRLWAKCGCSPDFSRSYAIFLEAVARPVLSCDGFQHFGAVWTDSLPKTHVARLKAKGAAIASLDGNSE